MPAGSDPAVFDVAIIGLGPVGTTLANLLGARGLRVAVLEREREIHPLPRACHLDDTSLRVLQEVGLAGEVLSTSVPSRGMDMLDRRRRPFLTFAADYTGNRLGYPTSVLFWQPTFERILRSGVARFSKIEVNLGWEVVEVVESSAGVRLEARQSGGEGWRRFHARYAVGCEGARSLTRSYLGGAVADLGFDQAWLVVDVRLSRPASLPDRIVQYCDPARPATFVPLPDRYRRWELMALPGEDLVDLERFDTVRRLLSRWLDPDGFEVVRSAVYRFHALVAEIWRRGRLLVAGDAAHQMPPFLGQGLCSGMRDAGNLAWKLAWVVGGRAGDSLLDTYQEERALHVQRLCERAVEIGRLIQATEAEAASLETWEPQTVPGTSGAAPLFGGLLTDTPGAGELIPQPVVEGTLLDERLGPDFAVVSSSPLREDAGLVRVATEALRPWLEDRGADFAIVRPDRYVYATGKHADLAALAGQLAARLAR